MPDNIELSEEQEQTAAEILGNEEEDLPTQEYESHEDQSAKERPSRESVTHESEEEPELSLGPDDLRQYVDDGGEPDPWGKLKDEFKSVEELNSLIEAGRNTTAMQSKAHERNEEARRLMQQAEDTQREALGVIEHIKGMDADDAVEFVQQWQDGDARAPVKDHGRSDSDLRLQRIENQFANQQVDNYLRGMLSADLGVESEEIKQRFYRNMHQEFSTDPEVANADWRDPQIMGNMLQKKMPDLLKSQLRDYRTFRKQVFTEALAHKARAQRDGIVNGKGPKGAPRSRPPGVEREKKPDWNSRKAWQDSRAKGMAILQELEREG